jgi:tyrosyl-tRNA synthetase
MLQKEKLVAIQGNALSVNKSKVPDPNHPIDFTLLNNKYLLLGKGKRITF